MAFRNGLMWVSEILNPQRFRKGDVDEQFRKILEEKELKAALEWRDAGRGVYQALDAAKRTGGKRTR